jgi:hypothetical protein
MVFRKAILYTFLLTSTLVFIACNGNKNSLSSEDQKSSAVAIAATMIYQTSEAAAPTTTSPPVTLLPTETKTQMPTLTLSPTITLTQTETSIPPTTTPIPGTLEVFYVYFNKTEEDPCGHYLIPASIGVLPSGDPQTDVATVLGRLFNTKVMYVSGLYNPLYASTLQITNVSYDITNNEILVQTSGSLVKMEVCDATYIKSQVNTTLRNIPGVQRVEIKVNGTPLNDLISSLKPVNK